MTFYVYKATGRLSKNVWELVSELDNYDDAVAAAEKLCPRGGKIETEPGNGLPKAYFGPDYHDRWIAMISRRRSSGASASCSAGAQPRCAISSPSLS